MYVTKSISKILMGGRPPIVEYTKRIDFDSRVSILYSRQYLLKYNSRLNWYQEESSFAFNREQN